MSATDIQTHCTRSQAFAGGGHEIVCYIDKKAVTAPQREALVEYVEARLGVRTAFKPADVLRRPDLAS
jgi:hypothetical protein